jgi:predicted transcriptional regulator
MTGGRNRADGELEAEILAILWDSGVDALAPGDVSVRLSTELAYTTVTTVLVRLWRKGLAERAHRGRGFVYSATVSEGEFASRRMIDALSDTRDRSTTLAHFVGTLSEEEIDSLRGILHDLEDS